MSKEYPLAMSSNEIERLRVQADLFRRDADQMLTFIGVRPGWRCLDLCCGIGGITDLLSAHIAAHGECIGLDIDRDKLAVACDWSRTFAHGNVTYREGNAFHTGLESASFDLVHTRFAVGIVPGGLGILDEALRLVRPGGWIFMEEADIGGYASHPANKAWDVGRDIMVSCFDRIGSDVRLGRKLHAELHSRGVENIRTRAAVYPQRAGDPMHYHLPRTLEAMTESILENGLAQADELQNLVAAIDTYLDQSATQSMSYTLVQAAGVVREKAEGS